MHDSLGGERGWPPLSWRDFEREIDHGSMYVGSPETVAAKIADTVRTLDVGRFDLIYSGGPLPQTARSTAVELYASGVIPIVRDLLAD